VYTVPPKKLLILNILDILRRYTDAEHTLTQREIVDVLEAEYQMKVDRKSVKRNLMDLIDFGYDIGYSETGRTGKSGERETMMSGWFLRREFDDSELRLLVDSVMFSRHIPTRQRRELIGKLERLSNRYFQSKVKHVKSLPEVKGVNRQFFYTISVLDEAIDSKRQVTFHYGSFDETGRLCARRDSEGRERLYRVDSYQLVATNGRYYLICHMPHADELTTFRVDRILDIEMTGEAATPLRSLPGYEGGLDLPEHMAEHLYMFAKKPVKVRFKAVADALNHVFDWFGQTAEVVSLPGGEGYEVTVNVNEQAMRYWALQFYEYVEVLEPESLRESLSAASKTLAEKYTERDTERASRSNNDVASHR
jgi:predicted DNA-binding transcriptional regulator YafY